MKRFQRISDPVHFPRIQIDFKTKTHVVSTRGLLKLFRPSISDSNHLPEIHVMSTRNAVHFAKRQMCRLALHFRKSLNLLKYMLFRAELTLISQSGRCTCFRLAFQTRTNFPQSFLFVWEINYISHKQIKDNLSALHCGPSSISQNTN